MNRTFVRVYSLVDNMDVTINDGIAFKEFLQGMLRSCNGIIRSIL